MFISIQMFRCSLIFFSAPYSRVRMFVEHERTLENWTQMLFQFYFLLFSIVMNNDIWNPKIAKLILSILWFHKVDRIKSGIFNPYLIVKSSTGKWFCPKIIQLGIYKIFTFLFYFCCMLMTWQIVQKCCIFTVCRWFHCNT